MRLRAFKRQPTYLGSVTITIISVVTVIIIIVVITIITVLLSSGILFFVSQTQVFGFLMSVVKAGGWPGRGRARGCADNEY